MAGPPSQADKAPHREEFSDDYLRPVAAAWGHRTLHSSSEPLVTNHKGSWGFSNPNPAGGSIPIRCHTGFSPTFFQLWFSGLYLFIGHLTEMDFRDQ